MAGLSSPEEEGKEERASLLPTADPMHDSVPSSLAGKIRSDGKYRGATMVGVKYLQDMGYRFSPVVSRRQGNSVERNRVKRSIREIMRKNLSQYPDGAYIVFFKGLCSEYDPGVAEKELDSIMTDIGSSKSKPDKIDNPNI